MKRHSARGRPPEQAREQAQEHEHEHEHEHEQEATDLQWFGSMFAHACGWLALTRRASPGVRARVG